MPLSDLFIPCLTDLLMLNLPYLGHQTTLREESEPISLICNNRTLYNMKAAERLFHKGNKALMNDNPRKAISLYNRSLKLNPNNRFVLMNKAGALLDLSIYDEALETIENAIQIDPYIAKCWGMKGDILGGLGRYDEALHCYDHAIELDPSDKRLYVYREQLHQNALKSDAAGEI